MTPKNRLAQRFIKTYAASTIKKFAFSIVALVTAPVVVAAPMLDQSVIYPTSGGISSYTIYETSTNEYVLAQTFTAGISGKLTGVGLALVDKASQDLSVSILETSGGLPDVGAGVLATETLTPADVDLDSFSLEMVDFTSAALDLIAGEMYSIMLSSTTPFQQEYDWTRGSFDTFTGDDLSPQDPYSGGVGYYSDNGGSTWTALSGYSEDFSFQTFVDPTAVPEPGSLGAFVAALAFLGVNRRRSSTQQQRAA